MCMAALSKACAPRLLSLTPAQEKLKRRAMMRDVLKQVAKDENWVQVRRSIVLQLSGLQQSQKLESICWSYQHAG